MSPWDIAAGSLIITEGGGMISDFNGNENHIKNGNVIAANKFIYRELLETISAVFKGKL